MVYSCSPLFSLLLFFSTTALFLAQAPATAAASTTDASVKNLNWDEKFEGVVHDANTIAGFVAEYRWLSNYYLCRVEWDGRVYGSAEAAYHSGKYSRADRDLFTKLDPDRARKLSRVKPYDVPAWETRQVPTMLQAAGT